MAVSPYLKIYKIIVPWKGVKVNQIFLVYRLLLKKILRIEKIEKKLKKFSQDG